MSYQARFAGTGMGRPLDWEEVDASTFELAAEMYVAQCVLRAADRHAPVRLAGVYRVDVREGDRLEGFHVEYNVSFKARPR